jgi:hypothetical protein
MNKLSSLLFIILFTSCVTQKQRDKICTTCTLKSSKTDSTTVTIKEVIKEVIVHDSISYQVANPCDAMCDSIMQLRNNFSEEITSERGSKIKLYAKNGKLHIKEDLTGVKTIAVVSDTLVKKTELITKETAPKCEKQHVTEWLRFLIYSGAVAWIVLIILAVIKVVKTFFKV